MPFPFSFPVGNIKTITDYIDASRNQSFDYDDLNRLKQAASTAYGTLAYGYNEIGNMTAKKKLWGHPLGGSCQEHKVFL